MYKTWNARSIGCFLAIIIATFCPLQASGADTGVEKLLTVAPDGMVGFVASSGGDELKADFDKAILGRMWNDPASQTFIGSIKQEILNGIKQKGCDANDVNDPEIVMQLVKQFLSRPFIIGSAEKKAEGDNVPVYGFAIVDAGKDKEQIAASLAKLEALDKDGDIEKIKIAGVEMKTAKGCDANEPAPCWGWVGNYFVLTINDSEGLAFKYLQGNQLRKQRLYLTKVKGTDDVLVMYGDSQKIADLIKTQARKESDSNDVAIAASVFKELGLSNVGAISARAGFSGADVVCDEFLQIDGPRTGLLAKFKTVDPAVLDMVDGRAMNAGAFNYDMAGAYDTVINAIKVASPNEGYPEITKGIADAEAELKFSIRNDLLASLTGEMVYYGLPAGASPDIYQNGMVVIAKLKDKALFEKSMAAMEKVAVEKSNGMLQVTTQEQNGRTVHVWGSMALTMMQIVPSWTIVNDHVVIANDIKMCSLAAEQVVSGKNSLRTTEGYKKTVGNLPENLIAIKYIDSKTQFNQMMIMVQRFWPMMTMGAAKEGIRLPFILPNLSGIINEMQPGYCYSTMESDGMHSYYKGSGIEISMSSVAVGAVAAGIMMPALAKTRQVSQEIVSGSNLVGIGKACLVYAQDHDANFPPDLESLIEEVDLAPKMLISPRKPRSFDGPSYIYIAGQKASMPSTNVIAYENPAFCDDKINVLFQDTHVEKMNKQELDKAIEETYKAMGKKMPANDPVKKSKAGLSCQP